MKFPYHDVIISVVAGGAGDIWWIFVIIVVILLLLILVMFGVMYKERNTKISYYGEYIMNGSFGYESLVHVMAYSMFGIKLLPEPILL